MNDDLTDEQRARALELYRKYVQVRNGSPSSVDGRERLSNLSVRAWLAVEAHVLASHTCEPVWRPTTRDEIQTGWEVRSRGQDGYEKSWGTAHSRDSNGDWFTESGRLLTLGVCWTYETTAPEPKPDPRVERFAKAMYLAYTGKPWEEISEESRVSYLRDGAEVLRVFDALGDGEPNVEPGTTPTTEETTHE